MNRWTVRISAAAMILALTPGTSPGGRMPMMWGVDEDDAQLFSIGNYTDPFRTFTDYGILSYNDGGVPRPLGSDIEAFTVGPGGMAYMATDKDVAGFDAPILLSLDLGRAATDHANVVDIVGEIGAEFGPGGDSVTGLSFDPTSGNLYALFHDNGWCSPDRLLMLDGVTGRTLQDVGPITGLGAAVRKGGDLAFDTHGNLYVTDNFGDVLYQVDRSTASIVGVLDAEEAGGLGRRPVKIEALAWDSINGRLVGADDHRELLIGFTPGDGGNIAFAETDALGLTDVEGIAFIPEPGTIGLLAIVAAGLAGRRRPQRGRHPR